MQRSMLTSRQAAEQLHVTVRTIHRWVNEGRLVPAVRVPGYRGAMLFDPATLEAHKGASK